MTEITKNYFEELNEINVSDKVEKKSNLSYLSWAWAWAELKKKHPTAKKNVVKNDKGWLYHTDGRTCWVEVSVTVNEIEETEYLPIMDFRNQSIPADKVTSMNVNTSLQRAITKAIARHGLGLYIYAGEDLPESDSPLDNPTVMEALGAKKNASGLKAGSSLTDGSAMKEMQEEENKKQFARIKDLIESVGSAEELQGVWFDNTKQINALKKYAVTLFDLLVEAKDTMKVQFIG
jgi:hypothetical protein